MDICKKIQKDFCKIVQMNFCKNFKLISAKHFKWIFNIFGWAEQPHCWAQWAPNGGAEGSSPPQRRKGHQSDSSAPPVAPSDQDVSRPPDCYSSPLSRSLSKSPPPSTWCTPLRCPTRGAGNYVNIGQNVLYVKKFKVIKKRQESILNCMTTLYDQQWRALWRKSTKFWQKILIN